MKCAPVDEEKWKKEEIQREGWERGKKIMEFAILLIAVIAILLVPSLYILFNPAVCSFAVEGEVSPSFLLKGDFPYQYSQYTGMNGRFSEIQGSLGRTHLKIEGQVFCRDLDVINSQLKELSD